MYQSRRLSYAPAIPVQSLLGQVLGICATGLLVTGAAAWHFQNISFGVGIAAFILGFILLLAVNFTRANLPVSLALFYAFALCQGIGIAPTIGAYVRGFGPDIVVQAAMTTGLGMFALAAVVYATGLDLRRFSGIAMVALLGLIVVGVISAFTRWVHPELYAWLTLVIFTVLVLIDFARIRAGGDGLTPVQMALQIYLDAINIFLAVLQLLGGRRRD
ncbi:MAG: US12 family protein [Candidatus Eremiobacteraeota bacterium]|nr:US12 family protein [Candidatus Eremiobacteraeota bacterium]